MSAHRRGESPASALLVADGSSSAGFGHLSRSSALATALRARGFDLRALALDSPSRRRVDAIDWEPAASIAEGIGETVPDVVVLDGYTLDSAPLNDLDCITVAFDDGGDRPLDSDLLIAIGGPEGERSLTSLRYACLRSGFWGLPPREVRPAAARVLVCTGGGALPELGASLAARLRAALPTEFELELTGEPGSGKEIPAGVTAIAWRDSLLRDLLTADTIVATAGQTALEAAAAGTPAVLIIGAENQRPQAEALAGAGAAALVDPSDEDAVARAVIALVDDNAARRERARAAQTAVDGYGALRTAWEIEWRVCERHDEAWPPDEGVSRA